MHTIPSVGPPMSPISGKLRIHSFYTYQKVEKLIFLEVKYRQFRS